MQRFFAALAATALLSGCAGVLPVPSDGAPLKVASWNLEHLAELDGQGCRPRVEADYAVLRRRMPWGPM